MIQYDTVIFDLDGVITKTAVVHASAWKEMFDEYMHIREQRDGEEFRAFTHEEDYLPYVDGRPRYKGVETFLKSRDIDIPFGDPIDEPGKETCCGLGNKKNLKFREILERDGVQVYEPAVALIKNLKENDVRVGCATSSKNGQFILEKCGMEDTFETRVDGIVSAELGLQGKPEPDIFVKAADNIGSKPDRSVVVEDAVSGVAAGQKGGFALTLGVARENNEKELEDNGADIVVTSFEGVDAQKIDAWINQKKSQ